MRRVAAWLLWLGAAAAWPAAAAEITGVAVSHGEGAYHLSLEAEIHAPPLAVFAVITDYDRLTRLHESIRRSEVLRRIDACTTEVYTEVRACVAVFCRTVRRVERIEEDPPHELRATIVPDSSNVSSGEVVWRLEPDATGTHLSYASTLNPDFWIPPLVGPGMMKLSLETTTREMIQNVEDLARQAKVGGGEPWREQR